MAESPSVRSAYSDLVGVLAKCFPSKCAHLKKLPKTQNIINDWQVLLNNPQVAERDVELFHSPPLSALGLSRLYKEGKLTPNSQANIWGYIDQVLEAMQPPVEVPNPQELRMMQSLLGGQQGGQQGGINLGNFADLIKGRLADNPDLALMVGGLLESNGDFGSLLGRAGNSSQINQALADPRIQEEFRRADNNEPSQLMGGLAAALSGKPDADFEQKANSIFELIPENLKEKLKTFSKDITDKEGDPFANALSLLTTHFNAQDFQDVAAAIVPNLGSLAPKNA
jgi:hypothetical protein